VGLNPGLDCGEDVVDVVVDFSVAEAEEGDAEAFEGGLAIAIVNLGIGVIVVAAIHFDREFEGFAVKIDDEVVNWALSIEVVAQHLFAFEVLPQLAFAEGHVVSQAAGAFFEDGVVGDDGVSHRGAGGRLLGFWVRMPRFLPPLAPPRRGI
jgi:hypothetical protein